MPTVIGPGGYPIKMEDQHDGSFAPVVKRTVVNK